MTFKKKHPRTPHLPNSPGIGNEDKVLSSIEHLHEMDSVVVSVKLDGEAFTGYYNGVTHARSLDSNSHISRSWSKGFWANVFNQLPSGWRVQCENLYAKHAIQYDDLESFLYGIIVWNDKNECLAWDESMSWFHKLNIPSVPVIYKGKFDLNKIEREFESYSKDREVEGFVIRNESSFRYDDFQSNMAKWVRKGHVQFGEEHFLHKKIIPNKLRKK